MEELIPDRIKRTAFLFASWNSRWNTAEMARNIRMARLSYTPEEWISLSHFNASLISFVYALGCFFLSFLTSDILFILLLVLIPLPAIYAAVLFIFIKKPGLHAKARGRKIDTYIYFAVNYIATMSSSGMAPLDIFRNLARNPAYGEISKESALVVRNTDVMGLDLTSALRDLINVTPSESFREFIQGLLSTFSSGGEVSSYLKKRLEEYEEEKKIDNRKTLENLGMLAEVFVITAVAFPAFISIIILIMAIFTGGGDAVAWQLFAISCGMLPVILFAFGYLIKGTQERVEI